MPRFREENIAHNVGLLGPIEEIAAAKRCLPAQVALAWVLAKGEHIVPIPGSKRRDHLLENITAVDIVLDQSEIAALDLAAPPDFTAGDRYPAGQMRVVNV